MDGEERKQPSEQDWKAKYDELLNRYVNLLKVVDDAVFITIQSLINLQAMVKQLRQQVDLGEGR
ncbi:MAG: hypothetical protein QXX41_02990 [Nitrososphaerota archaeon]